MVHAYNTHTHTHTRKHAHARTHARTHTHTHTHTRTHTHTHAHTHSISNFTVCFSAEGDTYSGQFKHGELHGCGVMRYASGEKFEGEYRYGIREGIPFILLSLRIIIPYLADAFIHSDLQLIRLSRGQSPLE